MPQEPEIIKVDAINLDIDHINNITQKEQSLKKAGVSRYKYLRVIAEALEATKLGDIFHNDGNITRGPVPDIARRQWGAEQAAKLYGDMIERKEIEHDIGDKTLDKMKQLSVADLRAQAKEILAGRPMKRIDVTVTEVEEE